MNNYKKKKNREYNRKEKRRYRQGRSRDLGHKKSSLVERHAPEAMAMAVTATCLMVEATAA